MIFTLSKEYWYTPKAANNLEAKEDEQIQVKILRPDYIQHSELTGVECSINKESTNDIKMITKVDYKKIIKNHVKEIKNLEIDTGSGATKITTGEQLLGIKGINKALRELIDEISNAVISDELGGDLGKN
jgi:hypothetical protein